MPFYDHDEMLGISTARMDEASQDRLKLLLHGRSGTGKTTLAATIAELGPVLYVDLPGEYGVKSVVGMTGSENIDRWRPTSVEQLDDVFWKLQTEPHNYNAIIVESLSALQKMFLRYLLGHSETKVQQVTRNPKQADMRTWGRLLELMTDFTIFWYGLASAENDRPVHVIMTSQTKPVEEGEGDSRRVVEIGPDVSKGSRSIVQATPDFIGYCHHERIESDDLTVPDRFQPVVRFGPHDLFVTKFRQSIDAPRRLPDVMGVKSRVTLPKLIQALGIPSGAPTPKKTTKKTTKTTKEVAA